ncbi:MAG: hypothetical protein QXP29_07880 [Candidatus Nezhaarchaeales archaeon]
MFGSSGSGWLGQPGLEGVDAQQCICYVIGWLRLFNKENVGKLFKRIELNKSSYEAFSSFLTFLENTRELDELVTKLK